MKVTKSYITQLVKEELRRKLKEGERFDAMVAKKKAERRYQDNKAGIDPLKDRFQTDDRYKDSAYIDDIMAVAPELTREQAIEIAELFSDEVGMADRLNEYRDLDKFRAPSEEEINGFIKSFTYTLSDELYARNALLYGSPSTLQTLKSKLKSGKDINISELVGIRYAPEGDRREGTMSIEEFKSMIGKPRLVPLLKKLTQSKEPGLAEEAAEYLRLLS